MISRRVSRPVAPLPSSPRRLGMVLKPLGFGHQPSEIVAEPAALPAERPRPVLELVRGVGRQPGHQLPSRPGRVAPAALGASAGVVGDLRSPMRRTPCKDSICLLDLREPTNGGVCEASATRVSSIPSKARGSSTGLLFSSPSPARRVSRLAARLPLSTEETYWGLSGSSVRVSYQL